MCGPGFIRAKYDKDDPSTWAHFQTREQKSTEEGRMTNPFASEDGRYDELSGQTFAIQTQPGGRWGSNPTKPDLSKNQNFWNLANFDVGHSDTYYGNNTVWQAMRKIDHRYEIDRIRNESKQNTLEIEERSSSGNQRFYGSDGTTWNS